MTGRKSLLCIAWEVGARAGRPIALHAVLFAGALLVLGEGAAAQTANAGAASPVFADFHVAVADSARSENFILRTPLLVGGASYDAVEGGEDLLGFGALLRPLGERPGRGELILGASYLERAGAEKLELQAKYVGARGIGMGAGLVAADVGADLWFASAVARGKRGGLSYHATALVHSDEGRVSPGGYIALYTDHVFVSAGRDGVQWRVLGAFSANNDAGGALDPSLEVFYVDNSAGPRDGETFLFVNGSLKRNRGFLSTASRLGRALGPQGMQFANPVSFVSQPWSRTVDVWETGGIMNVRLMRRAFPGGGAETRAEAVIFPVQAFGGDGPLRGLFAGAALERGAARSNAVLLGHAARFGDLWLAASAAIDAESGALSGSLGIRVFR